MKVQNSENKLVITEEFIFDQNKLPSDPNNHFNSSFCHNDTIHIYSLARIPFSVLEITSGNPILAMI